MKVSANGEVAELERTVARLRHELQTRTADLQESLKQQTATAEVLRVINASPGNTKPVFDAILEKALLFSGSAFGLLVTFDGEAYHIAAHRNVPPSAIELPKSGLRPEPGTLNHRIWSGEVAVTMDDIRDDEAYRRGVASRRILADEAGARSQLMVALRKDKTLLGLINIYRTEVRPFTEAQIATVRAFADQAVIAMENARLLAELRERTDELARRNSEYGERIQHQSATIDVLKAMSTSPDATQTVFDLITHRARELCNGPLVGLFEFDGELIRLRSSSGVIDHAGLSALYPTRPTRETASGRAILEKQTIHIRDVDADPDVTQAIRDSGSKSILSMPLMRDNSVIGAISLNGTIPGGFSDGQVALLQTFAEQAVIAITSAETYRALQERTEALALRNSAFGERISQQAATIDVLKSMSASPGDTQPVFDLIARRAAELCESRCGLWQVRDGQMDVVAHHGLEPEIIAAFKRNFPQRPDRSSVAGRAILDRQVVHVGDIAADLTLSQATRDLGGTAVVAIPLQRDDESIGAIVLNGRHDGGFSDSQIALLQTFAEQAVIAISSAETYRTLQERTEALAHRNSEYGERIEQQAAMIEVLEAISTSAGDDQPVLELITHRARELCEAETTGVFSYDGSLISFRCWDAAEPEKLEPYIRTFPRPPSRDLTIGRAILDREVIEINDADSDQNLAAVAHAHGNRSIITLPFFVNDRVAGGMSIGMRKPGGLTDSQKALARILAKQASIAIGAAATMRQLKDRTATLAQTVAELQALEEVLRAVNSSLDLDTVLATIISRAVQLSNADQGTIYEFDRSEQVFVPKAAFGMTAANVETLRERRIRIGETPLGISVANRAPLHIPDLTQRLDIDGSQELVAMGIHALLAVPLLREHDVVGGLVIRRRSIGGFAPSIPALLRTFAGQCVLAIENARLFQEARQARTAAEAALADLRRAQDRLVQAEKMASLGQLTAGIAHEIKNPLNFVNNFSDLSRDLLDELNEAVAANQPVEVADLTATLKGNLEKIAQHGRRADSIVKNMLLHSRTGPSERRATDLNAVVEEALNLAYHGARAETPGFNITLQRELDSAAGLVELYPQEFTRVMVNLINNGFYAASRRAGEPGFEPTLRITTRDLGAEVEVRVRDNGVGIDTGARGRIFEPFFTTKPAGEGTGLGLSLSYDIIVKQHGGRLIVDSDINVFTEFVITLPRTLAADGGDRP